MTSESRKKVQLYIYPDQKPQDKVAADYFAELPTGLRSQAYRNALVSGVALSRLDSRLPELLAVALSTEPTPEELKRILLGVIGGQLPVEHKSAVTEKVTPEPEPVTQTPPAEPKPADEKAGKGDEPKLSETEIMNLGSNFAV